MYEVKRQYVLIIPMNGMIVIQLYIDNLICI